MSNQLTDYILHLADTTLIMSQRNSEWCGHGPILEQDIAITNISLDLLGQSRNFYQYAAQLINQGQPPLSQGKGAGGEALATEDALAYLRTEREFKNLLLVEQPNGDWAQTVLRQYLFSQFQQLLFEQLQHHDDAQLAAITAKALKEIAYHVRWSSEWVIRLGDGTEESHTRMENALSALWAYTGEMFELAGYEKEFVQHIDAIKEAWMQQVSTVLNEATLSAPANVFVQTGGKNGVHTEYMGFILAEMQYMQRAYPGCEW